jgi:hypothetical protein
MDLARALATFRNLAISALRLAGRVNITHDLHDVHDVFNARLRTRRSAAWT